MKLRTFIAADLPAAMALARAALGNDAVILSSTADRTTKQITVTAAIEDDDDIPPAVPIRNQRQGAEVLAINAAAEAWLTELSYLLRYHGVPEALAGRITYKARQLDLEKLFALQSMGGGMPLDSKALARLLATIYQFKPLTLAADARIMLVGPPGVGKTLAIAKMAAAAAIDRIPVTVFTTDNKRAGGVEQLAAFTRILKLPLKPIDSGNAMNTALHAVPAGTLLLIDTAGCNPYANDELKELDALIAAAGAEPILTLPAGMDPYEASDAARAFGYPTISRMLITRADAARRFGGVLAAADARSLAFAGLSQSARVVGEVTPIDTAKLARMLLEYQQQTR